MASARPSSTDLGALAEIKHPGGKFQAEVAQVGRAATLQHIDGLDDFDGSCLRMRPSGWSMSVMSATHFLPMRLPVSTMQFGEGDRVFFLAS